MMNNKKVLETMLLNLKELYLATIKEQRKTIMKKLLQNQKDSNN